MLLRVKTHPNGNTEQMLEKNSSDSSMRESSQERKSYQNEVSILILLSLSESGEYRRISFVDKWY